MLKKYREFLLEGGLDLDLGGLGGDKKKEEKPDPEKEIEKEKAEKRKAARKERAEHLDAAEEKIKKCIEKTSKEFRAKFEKRIFNAIDEDDRVLYHNLIIDIQTYEMPLGRDQETAEIDSISPIIKELQQLNKNEYRG